MAELLTQTNLNKMLDHQQETQKNAKVSFRAFIFRSAILLSLCNLNYGYGLGVSSTSQTALQNSTLISDTGVAYYSSVINLGSLVGSLLGGFFLMKYLGRRLTLLISGIVLTIGWVFLMVPIAPFFQNHKSELFVLLIIGRIFVGIGVGINSVCIFIYLNELLTVQLRSFCSVLPSVSISLGLLLAFVFGLISFVIDTNKLEKFYKIHGKTDGFVFFYTLLIIPLVGLILSLYQLLIAITLPESPNWIILTHLSEDVVRFKTKMISERLYNKPDIYEELVSSHFSSCEISKTERKKSNKKKSISISHIRLLGLGISMFFLQNFQGVYGLLFNLNLIFAHGANVSSSSCQLCHTLRQSALSALAVGVILFIAGFTSIYISRKLGRKIIGFAGGLFLSLPVFVLAVYFKYNLNAQWVPIFMMVFYFFIYGNTWCYIPWVVMTEIAYGSKREIMLGAASISNWIGSFVVTLIYFPLSDYVGLFGVFIIFGFCSIFTAFMFLLFIPETKNKDLKEARSFFKSNKILVLSFK